MSTRAKPGGRAELAWRLAPHHGADEAQRLLRLLQAVRHHRAIGAAAREAGLSYRSAWGLLREWETTLGRALVRMQRGRGSELSELGAELLRIDSETRERLARELDRASRRMTRALARLDDAPAAALIVHASHDYALLELAALASRRNAAIEVELRGSLEALRSLANARCDVAGFHCARGGARAAMWAQYRPVLDERRHALLPIARRTQGIIVAAGNPLRIRTLRDLTRARVRFVNRQRGAGTRLLLDALLQARGISPAEVHGYGSTEFTHAAIAAMIASNQADAGLGVETAARRAGLGFIALVEEDYLLALRHSRLELPAVRVLREVAASGDFARTIEGLPGYSTPKERGILDPSQWSTQE